MTVSRRLLVVLGLILGAAPGLAGADQLDGIRKNGILRAAIFDSNPPFGSIDPKSHELVGYDVDFANAIARELGVKLAVVTTNPANRIPLLQSGKVDLIIADMTITPERAKVINFSIPYFVTGQQLLVPKDAPSDLNFYSSKRIGAVKGTTQEQFLAANWPKARVISYDDIPLAFTALRNGSVDAITQDSSILAGLIAKAADRDNFKVLPGLLTHEDIGIGVPKNQQALLDKVNGILVGLEAKGEAVRIYDTWFGPGTDAPTPRSFTIVAP